LGAILGLQMKYLTDIEIRTLINLGRTLEIFLGRTTDNNETINWISLTKNKAGQFELSTHSVFDDGDIDHLDIYSFEPIDPDEPFQIRVFTTLDEALTVIRDNHKLTDLRFVNQRVIQNEYKGLKEKDNV
jgi:hypothetical protein